MKLQIVAKVRIVLQLGIFTKDRPASVPIPQEQTDQALRQLVGHFSDGQPAARAYWAFDLKVVRVIDMKALQSADDEVIYGKPGRTAPVGVAAEQSRA